MDCAFADNMVDGLFFCTTFTGHRGGHTPFVQAGAKTSHTDAEAVKPEPRCSWEGHSTRWMPVSGIKVRRSLVVLSNHSAGARRVVDVNDLISCDVYAQPLRL